jgi:SAM-dependent methyltransferase
MDFRNVYEDAQRAAAYATLEFPGTYYLAFRDIPEIIGNHVQGKRGLDFGCGAGRSTRFLKGLGFEAMGVDIAEDMLVQARARDPQGDYRRVETDGLGALGAGEFDVVLAAFTFDNIPTYDQKVELFRALNHLLAAGGKIINLVSAPEIYLHEWASFSTAEFPGNRTARRGDSVYTVMKDVADRRPVHDVLWPDDAYREVYAAAGLTVEQVYKPLGSDREPMAWISETRVAPWVIYVLAPDRRTPIAEPA